MRYQDPGEVVRGSRERLGLTQRELALRAGTSQAAISRIERGKEAPTVERLSGLLLVMGLRPVLAVEPIARSEQPDGLSYEERLREAASWNLVATTLEIEGAKARAAGHPATRR